MSESQSGSSSSGVGSALTRIWPIDWLVRHHGGQTLAAVSHSGVLDIVYRRATGRPLAAPRDFKIPNCALNWFHFDGQGWHLESWADRHHLQSVLTETPE